MKFVRLVEAFLFCCVALLLPYRARVAYMSLLAFLAHLPFKIFGWLARRLLKALGEKNPYEPS